jgi:hypothetical protein
MEVIFQQTTTPSHLIWAYLQWIQEGDEASKFYFDSLKKNNALKIFSGLWRSNGSLEDDFSEIKKMS